MKRSLCLGVLLASSALYGAAAQVTFLPPKDAFKITNDMVFSWDAGDLDGDGLPELVYSGFGSVGVIGNQGDGRWGDANATNAITSGHRLADLTGDGVLDLFAPSAAILEVQAGLGDRAFGPPVTSAGPGAGFGSVVSSQIGDFSGDGHPDLLSPALRTWPSVRPRWRQRRVPASRVGWRSGRDAVSESRGWALSHG
ncbi:MAG: hypothetical protein DRQ55_16845, partial [Planctomycetota bacterium]